MSFVKIHSQMFESSIMDAPALYRLVWFYMLMACDKNGNVYGTTSALSRRFNLPEEDVTEALGFLEQEDPNSTTVDPDWGGRRIVDLGNNLRFVVNYLFYRGLRDPDEERLKARERKRKSRSKNSECHAGHKNVTECHDKAEAEAEADNTSSNGDPFDAFWVAYPRKVGRKPAAAKWRNLTKKEQNLALEMLPKHIAMWEREGRDKTKIPHATTWLNQERWNDEVDVSNGKTHGLDKELQTLARKFGFEVDLIRSFWDTKGVTPTSREEIAEFAGVPF